MRITSRVFFDKPDFFKHFVNFFVDFFLVSDAPDFKSFRNDFADGHTGIERGNGILENHLDFRDDSFLSCKPALSKIFQKQLLEFGGFLVKLFKLRQIFRIDFPDFFLCVLFIATFLVAFRASDIFDFDFQYAGKFQKCAFEILFIFGRILF